MAGRAKGSYTVRDLRITKENLYMVLALWMENFDEEEEKEEEKDERDRYRNVGAVLVWPNDMVYAVDCSRNGVHGVARLLKAHPEILQDCKVFVSRKPCSLCTKLLVQSKVKKVFFLPIEPEYIDVKNWLDETSRVDDLFKVSEISQTVFVPKAGDDVLTDARQKSKTPKKMRNEKTKELFGRFWNEEWMAEAQHNLPWPAFDSYKMKLQVRQDFKGIMEWMALILVEAEEGDVFKGVKDLPAQNENMSFNPEVGLEGTDDHRERKRERKQAEHLITLAKFLAKRTDHPVTGVGAVIINKDKDIVGLGWNGFPTKALYGEFPKASKRNKANRGKKYPYIIHAEENALLMRNTKNIKGATLFVTKTPCDDCTPLIEMQGIKTVVLGETLQKKKDVNISYTEFDKKVNNDVFICFEMKRERDAAKRKLAYDESPATSKAKRP